MTKVRACGCTYRETSPWGMSSEWIELRTRAARFLLLMDGPMGWGELCTKLVCRSYETRDELHRILHRIAVPEIVPSQGRGRRGTLWHLDGTG